MGDVIFSVLSTVLEFITGPLRKKKLSKKGK
jgi:hypothetical protein